MFEDHTSKKEAMELMRGAWKPVRGTETVGIDEANGRFAAEDIRAKYNIPVVRSSGMDGICVNFDLLEDGIPDASGWTRGVEYERADTGDDFDDKYDTVLPIEWVRPVDEAAVKGCRLELTGGIIIEPKGRPGPGGKGPGPQLERGMNVRPSGSMMKKDTLLLKAGMQITPFDIGSIVAGGYSEVSVMKKPVVAFIPTGSELIGAGEDLQRGQNFDSNSHVVRAMLEMIGAEPLILPVVKDKRAELAEAMDKALAAADIVIINGGSSKGSEDFNTELLDKTGKLLFHWIKAAPGRPMAAAATDDGKLILNIAGPTLAAYYGIAWFVRGLVSDWYGAQIPWGVEREVTAGEDMPAPPLSILRKMLVSENEDGELVAIGMGGPGGPGPRGPKKPDAEKPAAKAQPAQYEVNAVYFTDPEGGPIRKGDRFKVLIVR